MSGEHMFDLLYYHSQEGVYIPLDELRQATDKEKPVPTVARNWTMPA